jgi:hypothetical protein
MIQSCENPTSIKALQDFFAHSMFSPFEKSIFYNANLFINFSEKIRFSIHEKFAQNFCRREKFKRKKEFFENHLKMEKE